MNNNVGAAVLVATCEELAIGEAFGLDQSLMVHVMNASTGRNSTTTDTPLATSNSPTFGQSNSPRQDD